jgi:hypothetical protein
MTRPVRWLAVLAAVCAALGLVAALFLVGLEQSPAVATCAQAPTARVGGLTDEQMGNAHTIVAVGQQMGVPAFGEVIAVAVAMQESRLINLPGGDRDSVGLFQQRANWGSFAQRHDPVWAAGAFYRALLKVPGWEGMALTVAAQTVQRSGFPDAYAQWQPVAAQVVAGAPGCGPVSVAAGNAAQEAAQLLALWGTRIDGNPEPKHDLEATASGAGFDSCGHHIALDADLLRLMLLAVQRFKVTVWNFATGHACDPFYHPPGMASDIGAVTDLSTGQSTDFYPGQANPVVVAAFVNYLASGGPDHLALGQLGCGDHPVSGPWLRYAFPDSCTHQHVNVHQNDPQWGPYLPERWPS